MPSIADTAARVAAAGVPVLFLDTCSILDVIRAPVRGLTGCVESASELVVMTTAAVPACSLVVGSLVPKEWDEHDESVLGELTRHLKQMDQHAGHFHGLCSHLGIGLGFSLPQYAAATLADRLHELSRRLLQTAVALDQHPDAVYRAYNRAITKRRPGREGGEVKDCTIFEECLEVCQQLRAAPFARKMIFCSSNTKDYCDPKVTPHPDVAADCATVGLRFTTNLPWAVSEVRS